MHACALRVPCVCVRAYVCVPTRAFVPHVQLDDGTHELALRDCHGRILVGTDGRATTVRFETLTIDRHSVRCPLVVFTPNRNGGSFVMSRLSNATAIGIAGRRMA